MKTAESNIYPELYEISGTDNEVVVIFRDAIDESIAENGEKRYRYNTYELILGNRDDLATTIEGNLDAYLHLAKDRNFEERANAVRIKRNKLLAETDFLLMDDYHLTVSCRAECERYRQDLRDITSQVGFPYNVIYPKMEVTT